MKLPKGFTEKPAYKVKANKSKKAHESIVKTVSNVPEGPPLPQITADELRELLRQVEQNNKAANNAAALAVSVPPSENYSTIAQWRDGPINDNTDEHDAWEHRGQSAIWDLNLLLLDQIEQVKAFIINRVDNSEKELIQNFEAPFTGWWIYRGQLKCKLEARNEYAPLKNGCDALSALIEAYCAARDGDFRQSNIKTIHGMAHWSICVVQKFEHEIILGRGKFSSNAKSARQTRKPEIKQIMTKLAKSSLSAKELWPKLYSALEGEGFEVIDCMPTEHAYKYRKSDLGINGEFDEIKFTTFSNRLTDAKKK